MKSLPSPSSAFTTRKSKILSQLSLPDAEYTDLSPKGSVDVGIRDLISEINARDGLVTTSSCAGRVSVYLEGKKSKSSSTSRLPQQQQSQESNPEAGELGVVVDTTTTTTSSSTVGGKGGGEWLYVSHDPVPSSENGGYEELFGLKGRGSGNSGYGDDDSKLDEEGRLIHFKFEPMILHVLTASLEHAQLVIQSGMEAGFRETGAVSLLNKDGTGTGPIVGVRSMGLSFESLVGMEREEDGVRRTVVSSEYLSMLVRISHERFAENSKRIERFRKALESAFEGPAAGVKKEGWEDADARRERKRLEGLQRKEEARRVKETMRQKKEGDLVGVILQEPDIL